MILPAFIVFVFGVSSAIDLSGCKPGESSYINAFNNPTGDIYSPGYKEGEHYPNDILCEYVVQSLKGYRIKLTFKDFDIEAGSGCGRDFVDVADIGEAGDAEPIGVFCGNVTIRPLLSKGSSLVIRFKTDFIGTRRGFHIQYHASNTIKSLCKEGENLCRNRNCYPKENKCDGRDDCGDGTDEEKCGFPLPVTECGRREVSQTYGQDRIIGGKEAIPGSWPWQAGLHLAFSYSNGHVCGGTLINAQWVVTASHCFSEDRDPARWRIHLGKHHAFKIDETEQIRYLERIIVYPGITGEELIKTQNASNMRQDYTLLKLNAPVKFTKAVRPACLPQQDFELTPGKKCWASGWGTTRGTGLDNALKEVNYTVLKNNGCKTKILKTMICTKRVKPFQDACHGDSGGPFVCEFDGKWYINGITSFGTFGNTEGSGLCAMPQNYAVFAKVSYIVNWIKEQINKYS